MEFQIDRGNLFSTEQSLSRSNDIPSIRVATFVEEVPTIGKNRTIEYVDVNKKVKHMKEHVVLTSFPTHLHSCFWANKSFETWREKKRTK